MLQFKVNIHDLQVDLGLLTKLLEWPTCIQVCKHNSVHPIIAITTNFIVLLK